MELESAGAPLAAEMVVAADEMEVDLELLVNLEIFEWQEAWQAEIIYWHHSQLLMDRQAEVLMLAVAAAVNDTKQEGLVLISRINKLKNKESLQVHNLKESKVKIF